MSLLTCDVRETEYFITRLSWVIITGFLLLLWSCKLKASVHHFVYISTVQLLSDWFLRSVFLLLPITRSWSMFFMVFSPMLGEFLRFFGVSVLRVYGFPVWEFREALHHWKNRLGMGLGKTGLLVYLFLFSSGYQSICHCQCYIYGATMWPTLYFLHQTGMIATFGPWTDLR